MSRLPLVCCCALAAALIGYVVLAQDKASNLKTAPQGSAYLKALEAEKRILKTLAEPTHYELVDTPLTDAMAGLAELHQVDIQFDLKALDDAAIVPSEATVTKSVRGITLRSGLELVLRSVSPELDYMVKDEVLLITTKEVTNAPGEMRVYDVRGIAESTFLADLIMKSLKYEYEGREPYFFATPHAQTLIVSGSWAEQRLVRDILCGLSHELTPAAGEIRQTKTDAKATTTTKEPLAPPESAPLATEPADREDSGENPVSE